MIEFSAAHGPVILLDPTSVLDIGKVFVGGVDVSPGRPFPMTAIRASTIRSKVSFSPAGRTISAIPSRWRGLARACAIHCTAPFRQAPPKTW